MESILDKFSNAATAVGSGYFLWRARETELKTAEAKKTAEQQAQQNSQTQKIAQWATYGGLGLVGLLVVVQAKRMWKGAK
jgi:hypothetical protein